MPKEMLASLPDEDADSSPEQALDAFLKLTERFRAEGAPGLHVFVLTDTVLASRAIETLRQPGAPKAAALL